MINLKHWREMRGISQLQLSKLSGVNRSHINQIEQGLYTNIGSETICKLCHVLKCTPNDLIRCEED